MSLATPQSITIDAVATDLNRIDGEGQWSLYASDDGTLSLKVSHQKSKSRTRRMVRLDQTVIAADPLTAENSYEKVGVYIVIDEPAYGFSDAEIEDIVDGLKAWLTSANILAVCASRH
jgi:predicted Zn-dependent peptidase